MAAHAAPIDGFVDAMTSWINAIQLDKQDRSKVETEKLKIFARMLAEDREFQAIYRRNLDNCDECDPSKAMNCVYAFLNAVSEASRPGAFRNNRL